MGGGGLRILGHKKWHVWRRDNIERVLRDEREHEEAQRATRDEQTRREQEARAATLHQDHTTDTRHINFFEKEEEAHTLALLRAEGSSTSSRGTATTETLGKQARLPWYATSAKDTPREAEEEGVDSRRERKRKRALESDDPLKEMRPIRDATDEHDDRAEDARVRRRLAKRKAADDATRLESKDKKHKKRKTTKDKKTERESHHDDKHLLMMQRLRREREEREATERERAERLLRGH